MVIWLFGYLVICLTKALMRLLYSLHQEFFKTNRDCNLIDGSVNLIVFQNWLKRKLKIYFNPLAYIIAAKDISPRYENLKNNKNLKVNNILSEKKDDNIMPATKGKEESKNIKCWLCTKPHKLMDCNNFKVRQQMRERSMSSKILLPH